MDSDSGEQSEGEPVTATGTEGSRRPSQEGGGQQEARPGQESARREADPGLGLAPRCEFVWGSLPHGSGRAGGRGVLAGSSHRAAGL